MKSIQKVLSIILIMVVCSCSNDDGINQLGSLDESQDYSEIDTRTNFPFYNVPIYSQTELIVQYAPGTPPGTKNFLRSKHGVFSFEICQLCLDESIEKWFFNIPILIEPKKQAIETFGGGVINADFNFDFTSELGDVLPGSEEDDSYFSMITPSNDGVTVAILDTGIDQFFPFWEEAGEPKQILYNATELAVGGEYSGWDFVDYDHNPFDDNPGKHGTAISKIYHDVLSDLGIPHQILPIKICNSAGETNYFKFLCGSKYAFERADVVNFSLGWYDDGFGDFENSIFNDLLNTHSDVIVVTSAGNGNGVGDEDPAEGDDNDDHIHYPSSYEAENVIAVAATDPSGLLAAPFSNYGSESVDIWAAGMGITFYNYEYEPLDDYLEGTSFAAPQIGALAAKYAFETGGTATPSEIKEMINIYGILAPSPLNTMVSSGKYYPILVD